jgi:beta-glucosidase
MVIMLYKDKLVAFSKRTEDLLSRMTLQEKIAQMQCHWLTKKESLIDDQGNFDRKKAQAYFNDAQGLGQVGRPSDSGNGKNAAEMASLTNDIQRFFLEETRLGIPVIFHEECLHGLAALDATSFPQPIGLACNFNPALVEEIYTATALEARSRGAHQALTPVLDVAREPRWGRVEETFGEDPYLVSQLGLAAIKGFQGNEEFGNKKHLLATLKHFAAHGQPESGSNCAPVNISERILRETFLYPFKVAIEEGKAASVMASYNEIDAVPSHASKWLLRKVLRDEWNFKGFVVSDYYAILELYERPGVYGHFVAESKADAARLAIKAGVNIELPEPDCYREIPKLLEEGKITESELDELIRPMLEYKFRLGLFDDPYVDPEFAGRISGCEEHRKLALQAARESIVMLKNKNHTTPLTGVKSLAIIGPNADRIMLGGYSGSPKRFVTVREGIETAATQRNINTVYAEGCRITVGGSWWQDEVVLSDPEEDRKLIQQAVDTAKNAEVIVLVVGGNEQTSREAWDKNHKGDRTNLQMLGLQDELTAALAALNKPIISVLFNGRPLSITHLAEKSDVLYECFYLGQEAGTAIAEVIFGEYNPSGKLPISIPRSVGHIPCYYNYRPSARRSYLFDEVSPLFPFGYGLTYTEFRISSIALNKAEIKADEMAVLQCTVTNTGEMAGAEVVQLYIRDLFSSVTRPVKELKDFRKVFLQPGESKTIEFVISSEKLAFFNIDFDYTAEPGQFELLLGNSSVDSTLQKLMLTLV